MADVISGRNKKPGRHDLFSDHQAKLQNVRLGDHTDVVGDGVTELPDAFQRFVPITVWGGSFFPFGTRPRRALKAGRVFALFAPCVVFSD
ncbi:hypothetical protein [Fimbriiglobus ruber]|uniref:hypothetical protein n=1 Tax=Fimbriiglobus ruber TaxID=1908690 RepID=UPI000B4AFDB9|nr:hypothetical protein [Fimbriiglobus ruber]